MAKEHIIRGISFIDPSEHVAISNYKSHVAEGQDGVHVIEMVNGRAEYLGGMIMVFGRIITMEEYISRVLYHIKDPEGYFEDHIKSLGQ
jgi:hypothetical protein